MLESNMLESPWQTAACLAGLAVPAILTLDPLPPLETIWAIVGHMTLWVMGHSVTDVMGHSVRDVSGP